MAKYGTDGPWSIDTIIPGHISAHAGIMAGEPTIEGTRIPISVRWLWEYRDKSEAEIQRDVNVTHDQILIAHGFEMGRQYQRSRKRRKDWEAEVGRCWKACYDAL